MVRSTFVAVPHPPVVSRAVRLGLTGASNKRCDVSGTKRLDISGREDVGDRHGASRVTTLQIGGPGLDM